MRNRWLGRNVDPADLQGYIEGFFRERGFDTRVQKSNAESEYTIVAHGHDTTNMPRKIFVKVSGSRGSFDIDLESEYGKSRMLDPLLPLMGFGGFVLRRLKDQEYLEGLEEDFWSYVENTLSALVESSVERHGSTR